MYVETASHISSASLWRAFRAVTTTVFSAVWTESMSSSQEVFESPKFSRRNVVMASSLDTGTRTSAPESANQITATMTTQIITNVSVCFFISTVVRQLLQ